MNYVGQTNPIGEYHGYGEYTWEDGSNYCGFWEDGEFHGKGTYSWPDGDSYVGDWVHGKRTGKGSFFWANSDVYQGDFLNGKRDGEGIQWYADGNKYQGQWCDGERHGHGLFYIAASQAVYDVSWVKGQANGYGKFITQQRDIYEGNFLNGKRHGDGTFTWADGSRIVGYWENGIRDDSKVYDLQPKLPDWSPPQSFLDAKPAPSSHFAPVPPPGWNLTGVTCSRESSPVVTSTRTNSKLNLGSSGTSSDENGINKKNNSMPEWQKKMLEKKREQQKTPSVVQPKDVNSTSLDIPVWKKKLLEKKQGLNPVTSQDKGKELVVPNIVIPEWQLKVLQRKREQEEQKKIEEQRKQEQEEQQKNEEEQRKRDQEEQQKKEEEKRQEQLRLEELKKEQEQQRQFEQEEQIRILKQQLQQQQQLLQQQQQQQQLLQQQAQELMLQQQQQLLKQNKQRLQGHEDDLELQIQQEQLQQILMELEQQELPQTLPQFKEVQLQQPRQSNAHLDQAEWGTPRESSPQKTLAALLDVDTDLSQIDQPDGIEIPNKVKSGSRSTRGHSPRKEKPLDNIKDDTSILYSISLITPRGKQAAKVFKKKINKLTKEKDKESIKLQKKEKDPCSSTPPGEESRLKKSKSINKVVKTFRTGSPFKNKKIYPTLESMPVMDKTPPNNDPFDTNEHPLGRLEGKPKEEGIPFSESYSEIKSPVSKLPSFSLGRLTLSKENLENLEEGKKGEKEPVLVDLRVEPQPLQDPNLVLDDSISNQIGDIQIWESDSDEMGDIISELDIDQPNPPITPKFKSSSIFMKKTVSRTGLVRPSSPLLGASRQGTISEKGRLSQPVIPKRQMIVTPPHLNVDELLSRLDSNGDGEVQTKSPRQTSQPISVTPRTPGKTGHLTQFFGDLQVDFNDLFLGDV